MFWEWAFAGTQDSYRENGNGKISNFSDWWQMIPSWTFDRRKQTAAFLSSFFSAFAFLDGRCPNGQLAVLGPTASVFTEVVCGD